MTAGFYARLRDTRKDDDALAACLDRVVKQLEDTSPPGIGRAFFWAKYSRAKRARSSASSHGLSTVVLMFPWCSPKVRRRCPL